MSDKLYSIKESTLTDIGDALRRKHGETEMGVEIKTIEAPIISKTDGAAGFFDFSEAVASTQKSTETITIVGAAYIKVKVGFVLSKYNYLTKFRVYSDKQQQVFTAYGNHYEELTFQDTDTITFEFTIGTGTNTKIGYYAECYGYDVEDNFVGEYMDVEVEKEVKRTYSSDEMAQAIDDIIEGIILPDEAYKISGNCGYKFANGGWDWFIEQCGNKVTTEDITNAIYMFDGSQVENIPFEINFKNNAISQQPTSYFFRNCQYLQTVPKINYLYVSSTENMFADCKYLREIPEDIDENWNWDYVDNLTSQYSGTRSNMFNNCYSLRKIPMQFLNHGNPIPYHTYSIYNYMCYCCCVLDEIVGLPVPHTAVTWTSNAFGSTFSNCSRLQKMIFKLQDDGTPYIVKWKAQLIDLTSYVGYSNTTERITTYNSGITEDKCIRTDEQYQALKNDPDWFTLNMDYSRYNHDSAVATINSLPDASAYLATAGGTNTIKFKGAAGSKTDGGAINTLTAEEIAVATAKGWTVTLA